MSRAQSLVDHVAARKLVAAAVERFFRYGYESASVRAIAADASLGAAGFYEHFPSKLAVLREIAQTTYAAALAQLEAAVSAAGAHPAAQLDAAIWAQCDFAIRYRQAIHVIDAELVHLDDDDRAQVLAAKDRLIDTIGEILDGGTLLGVFAVDTPGATGRAVATMCASISGWYVPAETDSPRQIAETYCELGSRMAGAGAVAGRGRRLAAVPESQTA
ncbi:MAG: TetR/AcrR family transcriptional regulator [Solirubrobacteraceae bacterium]